MIDETIAQFYREHPEDLVTPDVAGGVVMLLEWCRSDRGRNAIRAVAESLEMPEAKLVDVEDGKLWLHPRLTVVWLRGVGNEKLARWVAETTEHLDRGESGCK